MPGKKKVAFLKIVPNANNENGGSQHSAMVNGIEPVSFMSLVIPWEHLAAILNSIPAGLLVEEITEKIAPKEGDILFGRGPEKNKNPGNVWIRDQVQQRKPEYENSTSREKCDTTNQIVQQARSEGRRFLKEVWIEVDPKTSRKKVSQLFRDGKNTENNSEENARSQPAESHQNGQASFSHNWAGQPTLHSAGEAGQQWYLPCEAAQQEYLSSPFSGEPAQQGYLSSAFSGVPAQQGYLSSAFSSHATWNHDGKLPAHGSVTLWAHSLSQPGTPNQIPHVTEQTTLRPVQKLTILSLTSHFQRFNYCEESKTPAELPSSTISGTNDNMGTIELPAELPSCEMDSQIFDE